MLTATAPSMSQYFAQAENVTAIQDLFTLCFERSLGGVPKTLPGGTAPPKEFPKAHADLAIFLIRSLHTSFDWVCDFCTKRDTSVLTGTGAHQFFPPCATTTQTDDVFRPVLAEFESALKMVEEAAGKNKKPDFLDPLCQRCNGCVVSGIFC